MNNRFTFKNLDASVLTTARIGFTINDAFTAAYSNLAGRFNNVSVNYWTPENQTGTEPRPERDGLGNFASARQLQGWFVRSRPRHLTRLHAEPFARKPLLVEGGASLRPGAGTLHLHVLQGWDPEAGFSVGNPNSGASQIDQGGPASARSSSARRSVLIRHPYAYGNNHDAYTIGPRTRRPRGGGSCTDLKEYPVTV
jgi:hypothetical protein